MRVLVPIEAAGGVPSDDSLGVLALARSLGAEATALVCGADCAAIAVAVAAAGPARVLVAERDDLTPPRPQPLVDVIAGLCGAGDYDAVLFATSSLASDVAGGLAARLEAGVNWDLIGLEPTAEGPVGLRLIFGDSVLARVGWTGPLRIALFRPGALEPGEAGGDVAPIVAVEAGVEEWSMLAATEETGDGRAASTLKDARVIVAGGRGMDGPQDIELLRELADALEGVAAVSMPVVERGWAPYEMQVGQTGTVVKPRLYVACGISGQVQHRVGMERSGTIVAINTDENAPIFRFCDLAVVADLHDVVPRLAALLREHGAELEGAPR